MGRRQGKPHRLRTWCSSIQGACEDSAACPSPNFQWQEILHGLSQGFSTRVILPPGPCHRTLLVVTTRASSGWRPVMLTQHPTVHRTPPRQAVQPGGRQSCSVLSLACSWGDGWRLNMAMRPWRKSRVGLSGRPLPPQWRDGTAARPPLSGSFLSESDSVPNSGRMKHQAHRERQRSREAGPDSVQPLNQCPQPLPFDSLFTSKINSYLSHSNYIILLLIAN